MPTTIERYPLERKKIVKKTIEAILIWSVILASTVVAAYFFLPLYVQLIGTFSLALLVLISAVQPFYQHFYYTTYFYDVRSDFLIIRKGVIMPRETILNYAKIQDVYVDQDLLDRLFGLWDVHVSTATLLSGAEAHLDGVNRDGATAIRELILSKIRKK